MSGPPPPPQPPHKGDDNDHISPPGRVAGRSRNPTPQSEEERRNLLRNMMQRASESLDLVSNQPGMPQRAEYDSHDAWLRALLASSLQPPPADFFDHGHSQHDHSNNNEGEDEQEEQQDQSESKDNS